MQWFPRQRSDPLGMASQSFTLGLSRFRIPQPQLRLDHLATGLTVLS